MKYYVIGFMFDTNLENVLLIKKTHPEWQKGKLNGVGGKLEHGELPIEAMVREFEEESGETTKQEDWKSVLTLTFDKAQVSVFCCKAVNYSKVGYNISDEQIYSCNVGNVLNGSILNIIDNIPSLITLSKQRLTFDPSYLQVAQENR